MSNIKVPDFLIPATKKTLGNFKQVPKKNLLFMMEEIPNISLYLYGTPTKISDVEEDSFFINPEGNIKLGWYVRQAFEKGDDLWDFFSESLVMLKLNDRKGLDYDVKCNMADSIVGMGRDYKEVYFFDFSKDENLRNALYFGAKKILSHNDFESSFHHEEIRKLSNFFYEDFKTQIHTKKSNEIALEADSILFS